MCVLAAMCFFLSCRSAPVRSEATRAPEAAGVAYEPLRTGLRARRPEYVVLLHGLARTNRSMEKLRRALNDAGYTTCNVPYPSTDAAIEELATAHVLPAIEACVAEPDAVLHFVTHSMGGLVLRQLVASGELGRVGRVVMLGPPNAGSEVADELRGTWFYRWIHGPAGEQLGTGEADLPRQLGPAPFELGVVAGTRSVNPILSAMIPGPDDGKVSVANAKLEGMRDFVALPTTHTFMMRNERVIAEVLHFLRHGRFSG